MDKESQDQAVPPSNDDGQLEIWREMVAVERARIANRELAVEVMREGFSKLDASDERHVGLEREKMRLIDADRRRHFGLKKLITWVALGMAVATSGVLLYMTFWGTDDQRGNAMTLATYGLACGASVGLGYLLGKRSRD